MRDILKRSALLAGLFLFSITTISCATYQGKVDRSRDMIRQGHYDDALKYLGPLADKKDGDQLVYLLDYAVTLQLDGKLKESNQALQLADRLAEAQDYQSVSRQAGSLLINQEMVQYKGDSFEKIFINAYGALNYLELNQLDDALVETRRMNEKYNKLNTEDRKNFEKNVFGKYLSALIWEGNQNWDDAYIAYDEAYKLDPTISFLPEDLVRSAKRSRRDDAYRKWKKQFPQVIEKKEWYDKTYGELVIIYEQGWGPRKYQPAGGQYNLAQLNPVHSESQRMRATISGKSDPFESAKLYDVTQAAMDTLSHDYASMAAKRIGAFATKEVVADQIRQKDQTLGTLAWIAMHAAERADLRQWSTLPQTVQMIRIPLKAGEYDLHLEGINYAGNPTGETKDMKGVVVKAQKSTFVRWRTLK
jgi:hypothetical protein